MTANRRAYTLQLHQREELCAGYHVLHFDAPEPLAARAGHFTMMRGEAWGAAPLLPRPMSLLSGGTRPSILIKVVGEGTRLMAEANDGARYALLAPLGTPWRMPEPGTTAVLVAGGVGVAPLLFLAEQIAAEGAQAEVLALYGGRSAQDLPLADRLAQASTLQVSTEDGSRGTQGRVTVLLEQALAERAGAAVKVYTCGPHAMMAAVAAMCAERGVPCEASLEAPMGCGYGVCLGCPVARADGGYAYTCVDGPCIDAAHIDWTKGVF